MPVLFLKRVLTGYTLQQKKDLFFFSRTAKDPIFCLLPFWISRKKIQELILFQRSCPSLIYLFPEKLFPLPKKLLCHLQPLYFMKQRPDKSFLFYDRRYLKTVSGPYLLPPVSVELIIFSKGLALQSLEQELLFPVRSIPFYLKGDTTHRLLNPSYLRRVQARQTFETTPSFPIYTFFKKILDPSSNYHS